MTIRNTLLAFAALLALSGCATGLRTQVNRFQQMPAPQGQSFAIVAADPKNEGGLEFASYAGLVAAELEAEGYRAASSTNAADLIVKLDYGVDGGRQRIRTVPGSGFGYGFGGFGPWDRFGGYGFGRSRLGYARSRFIYGFHDPFLWDTGEVRSYTVYTSGLDMTIERKGGERVFEGKAKAMSRDDDLTRLVPDLVEAMFTGFPGNSGETVRITVPPPGKR